MSDFRKNIKELYVELYKDAKNEDNLEEKIIRYAFLSMALAHNYSGIFSSPEIEKDLKKLSERILQSKKFLTLDKLATNDTVLHVMTEAHFYGGHTRVVTNWIRSDKTKAKHYIFLSDNDSEIPLFLEEAVSCSGGEIIKCQYDLGAEKAFFLATLARSFKYVVLHHHPYDILPLLSFGSQAFSRPVVLYNHADHLWGCGYSVCEFIIEPFSTSRRFSHLYRGIPHEKTIFGGIPLHLSFEQPNENEMSPSISTMASSYKFKEVDGISFQNFVASILFENADLVWNIIGVEASELSWTSLTEMFPGQVLLHGVLEKENAHQIIKNSTIYVDSFPFNSPTSVIEAVTLGVIPLCFTLGIYKMEAYEEHVFHDLDEFKDSVFAYLSLSLEEKNIAIRKLQAKVDSVHSLESFHDRISFIKGENKRNPIILMDATNQEQDNDLKDFVDFNAKVLEQEVFIFEKGVSGQLSLSSKSEVTNLLSQLNLLSVTKMYANDIEWIDFIISNQKIESQLFVDLGEGFNERHSIRKKVKKNKHLQMVTYEIGQKGAIQAIRWDPSSEFCCIEIEKIEIVLASQEVTELYVEHDNAIFSNSNQYDFTTTDPQVHVDIPNRLKKEKIKEVVVSFRFLLDRNPFEACLNLQLENLKSLQEEMDDKVFELQTELSIKEQWLQSIYSSRGWKTLEWLRKIYGWIG